MTQRTFPLFFEVLRVLVEARVTVVAEAAFQDERWRHGLAPLLELAELRIVRCRVEPAVSFERAVLRAATSDHRRRAHGDSTLGKHLADWEESFVAFEYPSLAPAIDVDTTDGYAQASTRSSRSSTAPAHRRGLTPVRLESDTRNGNVFVTGPQRVRRDDAPGRDWGQRGTSVLSPPHRTLTRPGLGRSVARG